MLPERQRPTIRLTPDQASRLKKAADHLGLTLQTFLLQAALRLINETESEMGAKKDQRRSRDWGTSSSREPTGLGLGTRRQREREEVSPVPSQAPVVVNVGDYAKHSSFDDLVTYVVSASTFERDDRRREALKILLHAKAGDEREELKRKFDTAIAAKTEEPSDLERLTKGAGAVVHRIKDMFGA